ATAPTLQRARLIKAIR
ncbi:mannitol dehydrogenase Rossmann domain protein, partial [Vibrio parahaemolyticus 10296]